MILLAILEWIESADRFLLSTINTQLYFKWLRFFRKLSTEFLSLPPQLSPFSVPLFFSASLSLSTSNTFLKTFKQYKLLYQSKNE